MKLKDFIVRACKRPQKTVFNIVDSPAIVLLYHSVAKHENDPRLLSVRPENFASHLEYLRKTCYLIPVEEFVFLKKHRKKFPRRSVLITFDDGYANNFREALPVLESLGAQAIFFISTSTIDSRREFWWDDLERIFLTGHNLPKKLTLRANGKELLLRTASTDDRMGAYERVRYIMRHSTAERQEETIHALLKWAGIEPDGRDDHLCMTSDEIRKLSASESSVIGAHGHTHTQLSLYNPAEQLKEISKSKDILTAITGKEVKLFSYPFGGKGDYDGTTIRICRELGFDTAYANFHCPVHRWTDRFQVPRILVRDWDINTFSSNLDLFFRC